MMKIQLLLLLAARACCSRRPQALAQTPQAGGTAQVRGQRRAAQLRLPRADSSFAFIHPVRPHYSTLLKFDTANYPEDHGRPRRILDGGAGRPHLHLQAAQGRQVPRRLGVHAPRTSRRPTTACAIRRRACSRCARRATRTSPRSRRPIANTVVFKLSKPNASMLANFATPVGLRLQRRASSRRIPKFPERNIMGTGPFTFVEHVGRLALDRQASSTATSRRASPTSTAIARSSSAARRW